jgi:uncharacterized membrane protein YraQ (UPF0718 family)
MASLVALGKMNPAWTLTVVRADGSTAAPSPHEARQRVGLQGPDSTRIGRPAGMGRCPGRSDTWHNPWAPIVAFMVASPLTSPEELLLSAGLFGWPFALIFFAGTIALGLAAGAVTDLLQRAGRLAGQARIRTTGCPPGACPVPAPDPVPPAGCGSAPAAAGTGITARLRLPELARELRGPGRRLAVYFTGYSAIGYLLIELLPTGSLTSLLSGHSPASIALAAALGIPVYITTEASLPMVAALVHGGLGPGPAMAFLVTGAGTSIGAITGAFVIARARVITLVVALLFAGALVLGGLTGAILG